MRKLLVVALSLFAAGCVGGNLTEGTPGDDNDEHPDDPMPSPEPPTGEGVSGTISANTSWSGTTRIKAETTIPAGVTVTVAPGTMLTFAGAAKINVAGTLKIEGTTASKVIAQGEAGAWGGFMVTGTLDIAYGNFTGGAIYTSGAAAKLVIADTKMFKAGGDYIIMNGGSINMTYSQIGPGPGEADTTHCNLHINAASTITVTNNNINGAPYGIMFYGGVNADFKSNNWYANPKDIDYAAGVSGDFSNGWFEKPFAAPPAGTQITRNNLSATKLTNAGPR